MRSIMSLVAVAMTLVVSALPVAAAVNWSGEVSIVTTVDQPAGLGTPIHQTATVTDTGPLPLVDLYIQLGLASHCTRSVWFLAPGQTVTVTCTDPVADKDGVVTATVCGRDLVGRPVTARATTTLPPPRPAVRIDVTATPALAVPGQSVLYTMSVTNSGDVPLDGLAVTATDLPSCDLPVPGPLASGVSATVECTTTAGERDRSSEFRVSGRDGLGDMATAAVTVDVHAVVIGLSLTLSKLPGETPAGHDTSITVRLTDSSSVGLTDLRITGTPTACDRDLPSLAAGATATYTCQTAVGARTVVALVATGLPAIGGTPVTGADSVTANNTLVLRPAAPAMPAPTTPRPAQPTPTEPPAPALVVPPPPPAPPPVPSPAVVPVAPIVSSAAVAAPRRPPVIDQARGPLAKPGRTALVIAVLAVLVMTVSVGALTAATRSAK